MTAFKGWKPHKTTANEAIKVEDGTMNALTGTSHSPLYFDILKTRRKLPVSNVRQKFLDAYQNNQIVLFIGTTGSGKTTQIPQFVIYDHVPDQLQEKSIACTQPRVLPTKLIASRVASELDVDVGEQVGYMYRGGRAVSSATMLQFMTDGLLLAQAQQHQLLEPYACVIIDEAHERGANTDILMGILKVVTKKRKDLKVVIMSATLDIERFEAYFPLAPTLKCDGRSFPVDMNYLSREPETPAQLLSMAAKKVIDIHLFGRRGDILVFVSGAGEMQDVMRRIDEMLKDYDEGDLAPLEVHELTAKHSPDDQERASKGRPPLSKNSKPGRKVIVATNVAETSITFDGLVFVVDTGRAKSKVYNPRNQSTMFKEHSISKAQAAQRAGRVGRREPGTCYRLYTERTFLTMFEENSTPALLQGSVTAVTLKLLNMNQDPLSFDFMQAPAPESVMRALEELSYLGCLQSAAKLSPHGTQVARYAMEPALAKMLIESSFPAHGCSAEIVSIIAMLEVLEKQFKYWITPRAEEEYAAVARGKRDFSHWSGMHLQMLMIYYAWRVACEDGQSREFCTHYGLQYRFLTAVDTSRAQMRLYMEKNGAQLLSLDENDPDYTNKIRRALCIGHFMHAAKQTSMGYKSLRHGLSVQFDEKKLGGLKSDKEWVIYNEVQLRDDGFELDIVTSVKVDWLIEACPDYFDMETFPPGEVKDDLTKAIRSMTKVSKKAIAGRSPPT